MAVPGIQRIWYSPLGFVSGLTVTAKLYNYQNVVVNDSISFAEMLGNPVYYADINFPNAGKYCLLIYENGGLSLMFVVEVGTYPGLVTYYPRAG